MPVVDPEDRQVFIPLPSCRSLLRRLAFLPQDTAARLLARVSLPRLRRTLAATTPADARAESPAALPTGSWHVRTGLPSRTSANTSTLGRVVRPRTTSRSPHNSVTDSRPTPS